MMKKQFSFNENAVSMRQVFEWATEVGCTEIAKRLKDQKSTDQLLEKGFTKELPNQRTKY